MTLTDFLLARIAEDEVDLSHLFDEVEIVGGRFVDARARYRADCVAKRMIVAEHENGSYFPTSTAPDGFDYCGTCHDYERHDAAGWPCDTIRHLAIPYADHPDYRAEWAL